MEKSHFPDTSKNENSLPNTLLLKQKPPDNGPCSPPAQTTAFLTQHVILIPHTFWFLSCQTMQASGTPPGCKNESIRQTTLTVSRVTQKITAAMQDKLMSCYFNNSHLGRFYNTNTVKNKNCPKMMLQALPSEVH